MLRFCAASSAGFCIGAWAIHRPGARVAQRGCPKRLHLRRVARPPQRGGNSSAQGNALGNWIAAMHRALKGQDSARSPARPSRLGSRSCALSGRGGFGGTRVPGALARASEWHAPSARHGARALPEAGGGKAHSASEWAGPVRSVNRGGCISVFEPRIPASRGHAPFSAAFRCPRCPRFRLFVGGRPTTGNTPETVQSGRSRPEPHGGKPRTEARSRPQHPAGSKHPRFRPGFHRPSLPWSPGRSLPPEGARGAKGKHGVFPERGRNAGKKKWSGR